MIKALLTTGVHAALSFLRPPSNRATSRFFQKSGGFCAGVCHPLDHRLEEMHQANIQWVRFDIIGRPLDAAGMETEDYLQFKARAKYYHDAGFRVMAVTPFPSVYATQPYSPSDPIFREALIQDIQYMAQDLQTIVDAFQIANELQLPRFRHPLTMEQSVEFLAIQLEALESCKGRILVGFNLQDFTMVSYLQAMKPFVSHCDYIGLDLYLGCFESVFKELWIYDLVLRFIWNMTRKPVWLTEFGYLGGGEPKTPAERNQILNKYGFADEDAAKRGIHQLLDRLPSAFSNYLRNCTESNTEDEIAQKLFGTDLRNHLYREIPEDVRLRKYPHNPEGQAQFMRDAIRKFRKLPFVCGAMVYCYSDCQACYCGQPDCPVENLWGLVDLQGERKPAWYAVRDAFAGVNSISK